MHKVRKPSNSVLHYYAQKQVQLLSLLSMNKCIIFLYFVNNGSTVIFLFIFISTTYIIKFPICMYLNLFCLRSTLCFTNRDYRLIRMTSAAFLQIGEDLLCIRIWVRILVGTGAILRYFVVFLSPSRKFPG
jgi:uncharacterized membrane protein